MKLIPGPKRILAEFTPGKDQSVGGIYLPEETQGKEIVEAEVIGTERFNKDDREFGPGDNIMFMRQGAVEIEIRGVKYFLVHEDNVIAVIKLPSPTLPELPELPPGPPADEVKCC